MKPMNKADKIWLSIFKNREVAVNYIVLILLICLYMAFRSKRARFFSQPFQDWNILYGFFFGGFTFVDSASKRVNESYPFRIRL